MKLESNINKLTISPKEFKVIELVEKILSYEFKNKKLLLLALTHRSYTNVLKKQKHLIYSNERIEFLGDAVLELAVSRYLYLKYPNKPEGILTLIRAATVKTDSLSETIKSLKINKYIFLGPGEDKSKGREKPYILANMYEAIVGAIYLDSGFKNAYNFIKQSLLIKVPNIVKNTAYIATKTRLQEIMQEHFKTTPVYEIIDEQGLAHDKIYTAIVKLNSKVLGKGAGPSKQKAQENAAQKALENINKIIKTK